MEGTLQYVHHQGRYTITSSNLGPTGLDATVQFMYLTLVFSSFRVFNPILTPTKKNRSQHQSYINFSPTGESELLKKKNPSEWKEQAFCIFYFPVLRLTTTHERKDR